jgi:hypothetical protein
MVGLEDKRFRDGNSWAGWGRKRSNSGKNSIESVEVPEKRPVKKSIINDSQVDVHV